MPKFKQIKLIPSEFILDVWIGRNYDVLNKYNKFYNLTGEDMIGKTENWVDTIYFLPKNGKRNTTRICLKITSLQNKKVLVHEIIHILWHLSTVVGYKMVNDSQEWQAVLADWIYTEILKNNYGELPD